MPVSVSPSVTRLPTGSILEAASVARALRRDMRSRMGGVVALQLSVAKPPRDADRQDDVLGSLGVALPGLY